MKYKIGDLVRVKSYDELSKKYHIKFDEVTTIGRYDIY